MFGQCAARCRHVQRHSIGDDAIGAIAGLDQIHILQSGPFVPNVSVGIRNSCSRPGLTRNRTTLKAVMKVPPFDARQGVVLCGAVLEICDRGAAVRCGRGGGGAAGEGTQRRDRAANRGGGSAAAVCEPSATWIERLAHRGTRGWIVVTGDPSLRPPGGGAAGGSSCVSAAASRGAFLFAMSLFPVLTGPELTEMTRSALLETTGSRIPGGDGGQRPRLPCVRSPAPRARHCGM